MFHLFKRHFDTLILHIMLVQDRDSICSIPKRKVYLLILSSKAEHQWVLLKPPTMFPEECNWIIAHWLGDGDAYLQSDFCKGRPFFTTSLFPFVPSSKSGIRRKQIIIKFSGKYIYSGTRQLNISGHILVSTHRTNQRTSPNTPGHQKDIYWHLRTDGRI